MHDPGRARILSAVKGAVAAGFPPALLVVAAVLAPLSAAAQQDNSAPVFNTGLATTISVNENSAVNTNIGSPYTATDGDDDTLTYSLEGTDSGNFRINNSGQLRTGAHLDYEARTSHSVTVKVSDDTDSATLDVTINIVNESDTGGDGSLTPSSSDAGVARKSRATYSIRIQGNWTSSVSPGGLPGGAHFTTFVGGIHNDRVTFLAPGGTATAGVEFMAELGGTSTLVSEVNAQKPNADRSITLGAPGVNSSRTHNNVTFTSDHPRITLTSMVAPSPDWFVGVSGRSLLDSSGEWLASLTVNLYPWDAGTENGTEFSLSNSPTNPKGVITSIRGRGKFTGARIARLVFTRTGVELAPAAPTGFEATPSDGEVTLAWDVPTETGITGHEYRQKTDGAYGGWTAIAGSAPSGANEDSFTVGGLDNGTQYTFQLRAANSVGGGVASTEISATPQQSSPELVLNLNAIAGDNTINIAEKAAGFSIGGDTGSEGGVSVTVSVGETDLTATSSTSDPATWSVSVPGDASYITGTSVAVEVNATKTGLTSPSTVERTLTVDLTAPEAPTYTAPSSLTVGVAIAAMTPSGGTDIDEFSATGLPSGLSINTSTGAIGGTPGTASTATAHATVTVSDTAANTDTVVITFPAVAKRDQTLTGFRYSASSVTFGFTAPTVTAPSGAQTTLRYSASPATVCTVNASTGALTLVGEGSCVITVTAAGTDEYNGATDTYTVTVQSASSLVTLTVAPATVDEHAGATTVTVTGTLDRVTLTTAMVVTVSVGASGNAAVEGTDYATVDDLTLTISAGRTSGSATFSLTPVDDDVDEVDETLSVSGTTPTGLTVTGTAINIADDDERGVDVSPASLDVPEGSSSTYTVVLTSEPTGNVTVTPSVEGSADVTLNASSLMFTSSNWDTAQTVTVSGAQDTDAVNDTATVEHSVSGADYGDNSVAADNVLVTVTDDDPVSTGIALTVSDEAIDEDTGATEVTVTGTLNGAPLTTDTAVTVTVGASGDSAVDGTDYATVNDVTLTIAAGQASGTAVFSVMPDDDDIDESDETLTVSGTASATDLTVTGTTIAIADDDERGVETSPTTLSVSEGGSSTYSVVLASEPVGPVTVTPSVNGSADVTLDASSLTFTASNWDSVQRVTVSAAQDDDEVNDTATVEHAVTGADYGIGGVTADDVAVTVGDDEIASTGIALTVSPEAIDEDASPTTVTVTGTLNNAPLTTDTEVTVSVGASGDGAVERADYVYAVVFDLTLMIDAGDTSGTVSLVLGPLDDDVDEDDETLTVSGTTSATGLTVTGTAIAIADDDRRGIDVAPTSLDVSEGGSSTYSVVLTSKPTDTVTVTPSVRGDSDVTLSPASLTFTTFNWDRARTVTVSAAGDADAQDDEATVEHTAAGGDYGSATAGNVSVRVRDNFRNNNVPVFPAVLPGMIEVAENTAADAAIGDPFEATDADDHTLGYALEGVDAARFAIDSQSGQLRTRAALDHESKAVHALTVTVDDGHGGQAAIALMVTVEDVDEQPGTPAPPRMLASPGSTTSVDLRWSTPERNGGPRITGYVLQYREGTSGAWRVHRHTGTGTRASIAGLAASTDYQARVRALNGESPGEWSEPGAGHTGKADNGAPVFDSGLPTELSVVENTAAGTDLGTPFAATDADGDTLTYQLDGADRHAFAIDPQSGQLRTRAALDQETKARYSVTVRADDGHGGSDRLAVTLSVTDIDEQVGTPEAPVVLPRNGSTSSLEVNWSAPDANGGPAIAGYAVQYRAGEEGAWIEHGHTSTGTRSIIDYLGAATTYQVRVRALNGETPGEWSEPGAGRTGDPANAPPVFADGLPAEVRVEENIAADIDIGAPFAATDADGDTLTWLLDGASGRAFAIDADSGQLRTRAVLDHESRASHSLRVRVNDGKGGADAVTVRVGVVDVDERAPPLSAPRVLASAGSTTSLDLQWAAPPPNGGPAVAGYAVQYRAGEEGPWIDHGHEGAGARTTIADLAAATDYQARVRALNGELSGEWSEPGAGRTGRAGNNAPVFVSGLAATLSVDENTGADSDIAAPFGATDADGDTLTWLLAGADRHAFSIDPDSGQLRVGAALDHEAKAIYSLDVRVSDGAGGADTIEVTVNVADLDERPAQSSPPRVLATVDATMSLDVRWSAPDTNGGPAIEGYEVQYRASSDSEWIDHPHEGTGTRASIAELEPATEYRARVRALNGETPGEWSEPGAGNTGNADNRAPEFSEDTATRSVPENSAAGDPVGAVVRAVDADHDRLTYFLEGTDADAFAIGAQTGQLRTKAALDYEEKPSYSVTVVANDGNSGVDTIDVTIEVLDLQERQAELGPAAPTGVRLGRQLNLDAGNAVQTRVSLRWDVPGSKKAPSDEIAWFEFRLGRYPESGNGLVPDPFQCAGSRVFEPDGWRRIPDSGPGGANARAYRFDAQALDCHVLPDTFELRAQVRAVSGGGEGTSTRVSAPSTEARMQDEAPRVLGTWLDAADVDPLETGDDLVFVVAFTEPVRVVEADVSPTLEIAIGEGTRQARFSGASEPPAFRNYGSGHIGSRLQFRYPLQEGDDLAGGIVVPADAISVSGGAAIADATGPGGHAADIRHPATTIAEGTTVLATSAQESLRAAFEPDSVPQTHDGDLAFSVQVRFDASTSTDADAGDDESDGSGGTDQGDQGENGASDGLGGLALTEASFLVAGGRVTDVSPIVEGENRRWTVGIEPDSRADVSISLGPTFDCAEEDAVCTEDGRRLANNIHAVIKGPPGLGVTDARAEEAPDATMDFIVMLSRALSAAVSVEYATSDGTATAAADYTETSGTLTFDAGEIAKTVSVPVLDDAHDDDGETFTLTLSNPSGANAYLVNDTATGTIENSDPMPKAWIARFGRTVSDHVIDAIQARLRDGQRQTETHLTLGGLRMDSLFASRDTGVTQRPAETNGVQGGFAGDFAGGSLAGGNGSETVVPWPGGYARELPNLREILKGSSFFYSSAEQSQDADAQDADAPDTGGFRDWSAWGRMAETRFRGDDGPLSLDGEVITGTLGVDARWNRWLTGVVLARSEGLGEYAHKMASGGSLASTLTSLHPFAQYRFNERTSVWGTIGYGLGELSLTPAGAPASVDTDLRMSMAALGGRGVLSMRTGRAGSFELAMRSDARLTSTESGASENLLSATGATSRVRVILEGRGSLPLGTGGVLTPTLEAGLRYDGGDAETGAGLEIGGGIGYGTGRLSVQLDARALVAHEDAEYEEWGFSASLAYKPRSDGRGLALQLGSSWGAVQSGVQSLWSRADASGLARSGAVMPAAQRFQAEFGYGVLGPRGRALWVPYVAADAGDASQALKLGVKLNAGATLEGEIELGQRDNGQPAPEYVLQLQGSMRW